MRAWRVAAIAMAVAAVLAAGTTALIALAMDQRTPVSDTTLVDDGTLTTP